MRVLLVGLIAIGCGSGKDKEASKDAASPTPVLEFVAEVPRHVRQPLARSSARFAPPATGGELFPRILLSSGFE